MTQIVDINAACLAFSQSHDGNGDTYTGLGVERCGHFGSWAASLLPEGRLTDEDRAFLALASSGPDPEILGCLRLLECAHIPGPWIGAVEAMSVCEGEARVAVAWAAVGALYGEVADRLSDPLTSRADAIALANLVEATTWLENWVVELSGAHNYIPMGRVQVWWPSYLDRIDAWVTADDLRMLSEAAGGVSQTEALSSITPPERLAEIYQASPSVGAAANPRLPSSTVNKSTAGDWSLLFHPSADPEKSWMIIRQVLEDGEGEDLAGWMQEFDNIRDDSWATWAEFAIDGPHAALLRGRITAWSLENIEDEDERMELLEMLGIDDETEDD